MPDRPTASYDVRVVITDVVDADSFFELRPQHAPNLVTGLARLDGRPIGVVANQPQQRAGTLDIDASRKAARFVSWCDNFNLPIVTFVDTPGFEPGRDLEWRGMIRHGAELVHAYCAATVPRCCVVMRKAYGGAYIVMDSRGIGNDLCVAWPTARDRGDGRPAGACRSSTAGGCGRSTPTPAPAKRRACSPSTRASSPTRTAPPSSASSTR